MKFLLLVLVYRFAIGVEEFDQNLELAVKGSNRLNSLLERLVKEEGRMAHKIFQCWPLKTKLFKIHLGLHFNNNWRTRFNPIQSYTFSFPCSFQAWLRRQWTDLTNFFWNFLPSSLSNDSHKLAEILYWLWRNPIDFIISSKDLSLRRSGSNWTIFEPGHWCKNFSRFILDSISTTTNASNPIQFEFILFHSVWFSSEISNERFPDHPDRDDTHDNFCNTCLDSTFANPRKTFCTFFSGPSTFFSLGEDDLHFHGR